MGNQVSDADIPGKFVDYYANIAEKLTTEIPKTQSNTTSYLKNRINHNFQMTPISPIEVNTVIDDLKKKCNNANSIASTVLVDSKHIITPIICHLINLFVEQGYFPDSLKVGCITPIFKGGERDKVNNYRPIC